MDITPKKNHLILVLHMLYMQVYNVGHNYLPYLAFMIIFKEYSEHKRDKIKT
jgi:hypothetical protein